MKKQILSLTFLMLVSASFNLSAESFALTAPTQNVTIKEGDDFFTDVFNDPMDFDKRRDILWEEQFDENTISVSNGVWSGKTVGSAAIYVLYQGPHGANATQPGAVAVGNNGIRKPLKASKYTAFSSFTSLSSQADRSQKALAWTKGYADPSFAGTQKHQWVDFYQTNTNPQIKYGSGEDIFDIQDLSSNPDWSGDITGVLFDQSPAAGAGVTEKYSMFRFFDPDSAPMQTISWSYSDLPSYAGGIFYPPQVSIYIDDNQSGFDGVFIARVPVYNDSGSTNIVSGTGSFTFPTAALPPGTYSFYLTLSDNVDNDTLVSKSGYSANLNINAKSSITFQNPSFTSGKDFATEELKNPWDFNSDRDITNLGFADSDEKKQITDYFFANSTFTGTAFIPAGSGQTESESQIWLNTAFPIRTSLYRYLTFKMKLDPKGYGNIADKLGKGWVARVSWYDQGFQEDGSITNDIVLYEGINTYSVDLSTIELEHEEARLPNKGWTNKPQATFFRFDPTEVPIDTQFSIYDMKLTANPEPDYQTNTFDIKFALADKERESATVEFFRDNNDSGFNGVSLGSSNFPTGNGEFRFSTQSIPKGDYYIYAKVTDAFGNTSQHYADVPITIGEAVEQTSRIPYFRLYNANTGEHFYTENRGEYNGLGAAGWAKENIAYYLFNGPTVIDSVTAKPWFRLFNPNDGLHHWTLSRAEYDHLGSIGWKQEGFAGYFFETKVTGSEPLYRLYNPNSGLHHWTQSKGENDFLVNIGWKSEGIAGYVFTSL